MADRFQHRRDTKERWAQINPILMEGEVGYELDTDQYKLGDGIRSWNDLPYRGDPCVQQEGTSTTTPMSQAATTEALKKRVPKTSFLNVSAETGNFAFNNFEQARLAVPAASRGRDQILVYQTKEKVVVEYCTISNVTNDDAWKADSSWKSVGSGGILNISEETHKYDYDNATSARAAVQDSDKKQGQLILYKLKTGWVYDFFTGADITNWNVDSNWVQIATSADLQTLTKLVNDTVKDINTSMTNLDKDLRDALKTRANGLRLNDENKLQLTADGVDVGTAIDLPNGIVNLSKKDNTEFASSTEARAAVKTADRFLGQVITYKLNDGTWILDQFIGESTGSWNSEGSWVQFALARDLTPILMDMELLEGKVDLLSNSMSGFSDGAYTEDEGEEIRVVHTHNGVPIYDFLLPKGGGGGIVGVTMKLRAVGGTSLVVGEGVDAIIKYNWTSIDQETGEDTGDGTVLITVNGLPVYSGNVPQGDNEYNLKDNLNLGANTVKVKVTDGYSNSRTLTFNVQKASLLLTSTFADDNIYKSEPVAFRYTVTGSGEKTIRFWLNGIALTPETTTSSGRQMTKNLIGLVSGANTIKVVAESSIEGSKLISNELYYEFIYADANVTEPVIVMSYNKDKAEQFEVIEIPFLVYDPANTTTEVELYIDGSLKQTLTVPRSRQIWAYTAFEQGTFRFEIKCGSTSKSINIEVVPSKYNIAEEKGDLSYKASAVGKSNFASDRASWKYGNYDAVFSNFNWSEDGWQKDDNGNNHLRLIGDSKAVIGITPFSSTVLQNGLTLTVEYATANVADQNAKIVECMLGGVGILMTPTTVQINSAQEELAIHLDSSSKRSISFVVEKQAESRLVYLFIDGIMSGCLQYPSTDNFSQGANPVGITLSTGGRGCNAYIYGVRWYENNLNFDQVFGNYVYDIEGFDEKIAVFEKNDVINDYGDVDYNKSLQFLPCLTIIGELPTYKGDKKTVDLVYEDTKNPNLSFVSTGASIDVQGTSSQFYPRKNFKWKAKNFLMTSSGETIPMYEMEGNKIPANVFCMKADFAESSGTHNTGMAVLVDDSLRKMGYKVPPQVSDDRVRTTVYGYSCLIFHKQDANSSAEFIGKYNFNDDKSSVQVFGFSDGCESWEFLNNTSPRSLFKSANFDGDDWLQDFEGRFPDGSTDNSNMRKVFEWVVSCIGNPTKFKEECAQHFNVNWLLFYCLTTEVFVMTDQRAKNQFLTTYGERGSSGELIWYFIFYDNDTILGINNEGLIQFDYNVESQDTIGSGHVWNGWDSALWRLVETAYKDDLRSMYQTMRQMGVYSLDDVLAIFQDRQADKWCESIYNRDGYFKYIEPLLTAGNGAYLYALQGSRSTHRVWFTKNRLAYMDSKYGTGTYMNDFGTMRLYTPASGGAVTPNADFNISVVRDGYFHVKYGSYVTSQVRGFAGKSYQIKAPAIQFNDTETIIYGVSAISSLGDLSSKYAGTIDITSAKALTELIVGSRVTNYKNENLTVLHTGSNELLKKINVANCPNLKQSLELSKCYSLEEVEARGSGITGLALPKSGILKILNLPATFTSIYLKNQPYLTTFTIEGYANVNTIVIDNVAGVDGYNIARQCLNIVDNKLSKIRLTNINVTESTSAYIKKILKMTGEDDNGVATQYPVLTGKMHINSISRSLLDEIREKCPELNVTYDALLDVIEFEDDNVRDIVIPRYDTNGDGELSVDEVQHKNIPSGLLTGSGAKYFDEARYWGGTGTLIDNISTLERLSIQTGRAEISDLPVLKTLGIYASHETLDQAPQFKYATVKNCFSIEKFILSGRYSETARKGMILAKQVINNITYYRFVLPLRGYSQVIVTEPLYMRTTDADETTYNWARDLTLLGLANVADVQVPAFPNLETIQVTGVSTNTSNSLYIDDTLPTLQNLIINDISGNNLTLFRLAGAVRNVEIPSLTCKPVTGSYCKIQGFHKMYNRIDFPATYQPESFKFSNRNTASGTPGYGSQPFAPGGVLIIRSPNFIPCTEWTSDWSGLQGGDWKIYVPDGLVNTYKAASNWNVMATRILPISNLG